MLPPDYIVRISLIRDEETLIELNPPVWRRFKISSAVNLDLMVDKISKYSVYILVCVSTLPTLMRIYSISIDDTYNRR